MKKLSVLIALIFSTAISSALYGQQNPPPAAGDKNIGDNSIKMRSVELDRAKRDANKSAPPTDSANAEKKSEDRLAEKYEAIKADYEQLQTAQEAVVKAYQTAAQADYAQISKSALEVNKSAIRLDANLFFDAPVATSGEKEKIIEEPKTAVGTTKSVREIIVELDNAVERFAKSPMFQNLRTVDAAVAEKTRLDLSKIRELSQLLDAEARKKAGEK